MFYSQFILAKKGPLGTIWIAAHLERKLRKNQVADTDIGVSVDSILSPEVPIALRLSSHLLLGVVRIYSRKVNYLFHDCSEALLKVKQAFRSTAVDLPPEESTAPYHSITLPETFDLDDFELPDSDNFQGDFVDHHVSTREQITLQDSMDGVVYSTSQFGLDERFGDGDTSQIGLYLDEELFLDKITARGHTAALLDSDNLEPEASGQPMTPFTEMDIDDDETMTEDRIGEVMFTGIEGVKIDLNVQDEKIDIDPAADLCGDQTKSINFGGHVTGVEGAKIDLNAQDEKIDNDPAADICADQMQVINVGGHDIPIEQVGTASIDTSTGSTWCAPNTPRLVEEVVPMNVHVVEDNGHAIINETSQYNSENVIMQDVANNLQYEIIAHDTNLMAQEIREDLPNNQTFHMKNTDNSGDSLLLDNKNPGTHVSHISEDTRQKQNVVDLNSVSFDDGLKVSSPTSVLAEQLKPTSPAPGMLDRASALSNIMERTETSQNGGTNNENPSSSGVDHIQTRTIETLDTAVTIAPTSILVETCTEPILSREGVSANCKPSSDTEMLSQDMPHSGCNTHKETFGSEEPVTVGSAVELLELCTPRGGNFPLESQHAHGDNKEESRALMGPEIVDFQHLVDPGKMSGEHRHVLRACHSLLNQPDTAVPVDRDSLLNAPDFSSTRAEPCTSILGLAEPVHTSAFFSTAQGEEFRPTSTKETILEANRFFESVPYNVVETDFRVLDECLGTVTSKDSQAGNFNCSAGYELPVPEPERLRLAPAAVPFGPNNILQSISEKVTSKDNQSGNFKRSAGYVLPVPEPERLRSAPAAVPFGPSDILQSISEKVTSKDNQSGNFNCSAGYVLPVPEPERLRLAPAAVPFGPSDILQSISEKVFTEREVSGNVLSGRKRQLMESTPLQWDGSSAKFSGMLSERTVGSIPNDNDTLSSILVGRKSPALKLRPSPLQPEKVSRKRPRVTSRTSVAKRKVLLDDTMVLHGDTIRLQLTSTEDIRRMRKKAPCTRPEIWMIQKQLLEDEVFIEPLFTGMSADLIGVHNQTYDVADFRVSELGADNIITEVVDRAFLSKTTNLFGEANREVTVTPLVVEDGGEAIEPTEKDIQIENRLCEGHLINPIECDNQEQTRPLTEISASDLQNNQLNRASAMEMDNGSEVPDRTHQVDTVVNKFPLVTGTLSDSRCNETVNSEIEPFPVDTSNETETVLQSDGNFDIRSFENNVSIMERSNPETVSSEIVSLPVDQSNGMETLLQNDRKFDVQAFEHDVSILERSNTQTVSSEIEPLPVDRSDGTEAVLRNDENNQSFEKDALIGGGRNHYGDNVSHVANFNEEGISNGVLLKKDESVQEVAGSDSAKVALQNNPQADQSDVCHGCSTPAMLDDNNCAPENRDDVLTGASTQLENDKPLFPNSTIGCEGSTDPIAVTEDYAKDVIISESGHVIKDENVGESSRECANNPASEIMSIEVPQRELSCPSESNSNTQTVSCNEDPQRDFSCPLESNANTESVPCNKEGNPGSQEVVPGRSVDLEILSREGANLVGTDDGETTMENASLNLSPDLENTLEENDTEFPNFDDDDDDDEEFEEADNSVPIAEEASVLDTSGWSSRTRGVARYLQTLFDTESGHGRQKLCIDNLLSGKTRKEASRMFFETLVLKTRDYIQVEQENPFDAINIKPRGKLVKSDF